MKISNPDTFRSNVCAKIQHIIEGDANLSINLEKGIYNYVIKEATTHKIVKKWDNTHFVQLYTDRLRSIFKNIKQLWLLDLIRTGEILPQTVAFMTHQEFAPEHWKTMLDLKSKRDASKYINNIEASTDMFTCKKCKSKRCTYYELQTRSADEPATIFVTCLDCGKHWKN